MPVLVGAEPFSSDGGMFAFFLSSPLDDDSCLQTTPCCLVTWREKERQKEARCRLGNPDSGQSGGTAWMYSARFVGNGQGCKDSRIKRKEKHDGRTRNARTTLENQNHRNGGMTGVSYL